MVEPLSATARKLLALEARMPRHNGEKEEAIRSELGLPPARYYQLLGRLIQTEAALAHDPMLVRRLRRIRDARIAERVQRTAG